MALESSFQASAGQQDPFLNCSLDEESEKLCQDVWYPKAVGSKEQVLHRVAKTKAAEDFLQSYQWRVHTAALVGKRWKKDSAKKKSKGDTCRIGAITHVSKITTPGISPPPQSLVRNPNLWSEEVRYFKSMSMRCKYMNPTKTRIQKHQPHWNGSGYTLSAPWRGSPKDLPAGWRDKPENVGAASRRNKSKCVLLIIRNFPPNRHGHTMTQKPVSHTELQGPSCSLQKTRLQEQKNQCFFLHLCAGFLNLLLLVTTSWRPPKKTEFRRRAATESVTRVDFAMVENDDVAQRWTPRHAGTERKLLGHKLPWRLYLSVSTFKPYITHLKRLERWCFPPM